MGFYYEDAVEALSRASSPEDHKKIYIKLAETVIDQFCRPPWVDGYAMVEDEEGFMHFWDSGPDGFLEMRERYLGPSTDAELEQLEDRYLGQATDAELEQLGRELYSHEGVDAVSVFVDWVYDDLAYYCSWYDAPFPWDQE